MISVALCTHNGERFLGEQLESILGQTLPPDEVVLSDDASTDSTIEIAESIAARYPGVVFRVLRNATPLGVTKNFEQAVSATVGDLIALSDQDDVWHPERLERIVAEFDARPGLVLLHGDADLVDAEGARLGVTLFEALEASDAELRQISAGDAFAVLLRRNLVLGASMVFRRELLQRAVPFPRGWVHDEWLAIVAALTPGSLDVLREPLIDYRQHGGNQIGARKRSARAKFARLVEPRAARNERLLLAAEALHDRVSQLDINAAVLHTVQEKVAHERVRSSYPSSRWRRLSPVLAESRSGRYTRVGYGKAGILADLLQSAR